MNQTKRNESKGNCIYFRQQQHRALPSTPRPPRCLLTPNAPNNWLASVIYGPGFLLYYSVVVRVKKKKKEKKKFN